LPLNSHQRLWLSCWCALCVLRPSGSIRLEEGEPANQSGLIPRTLRLLSDLQQVLSSLNLDLSYADLVQLGAAQAVEAAGGPRYR